MPMVDHAGILLTATNAAALKENSSAKTANKASFCGSLSGFNMDLLFLDLRFS